MIGVDRTSNGTECQSVATFKPIEIAALLVLAIAAILFLETRFYPSTLEDAYITFRYSEHLGEGYGFGAWNKRGEPVEGYTSFLWMLFLSAGHVVGIDLRSMAKLTGIVLHVLLCTSLISFPLLRRSTGGRRTDIFDTPNEVVLAGVFLALYLPLSWYATSGMETLLFTVLTGLAFLSPFLPYNEVSLSVLSGLLILTRPEGVVVAGAAIVLSLVVCLGERRPLRGVYIAGATAMLTMGFLLVHQLIVFGDIIPNTYWAKASGAALHHAKWGARYLRDFTCSHIVLVFLVCVGALNVAFSFRRKQPANWPWRFIVLCGFLLAYLAYIVKVGGDNYSAFPYWRHFLHVAVPIAFLLCYALTRLWPMSQYFHLVLVLVVVCITNAYILRDGSMWRAFLESRSYPPFTHAPHKQYFTKLKQISLPDTIIASSLGGELPYVVDAVHIDILGLSTRDIAKHGSFDTRGPQDSKTDMAWVMKQRPDIIEGYIPGTMVMNATSKEMSQYLEENWRSKMHKELVSSPIFQTEYMFVRNWPYHDLDRALFIRASYASARQLEIELDCIPVSDTPLSMNGKESTVFLMREGTNDIQRKKGM